ncbi:hypothetical protein AMAG_06510 [Allomyces macrogynus ATCC 38327]|uniref:Uncharacterized protein n=1 Tax=Allomyces macrogynus (strain ATCC 38327) TaxID=578462 RepID=A0A0L0SGR5_ALLM3|nr:hypothetical protein AMAG_06510 [Allomyces macrogynus ATCC 38327]|eukprot:KNE61708.1 hypothetical protein AMAG_06510 [Allomyces macrogynus ATCC 38327]
MASPPPPPHCPLDARAVRVLVCQETPTKARVPLLDSHVADHTAPNHPHHAKRRLTSPALDLLAPMMFGAMPLSHKGKSFKLHPIRLAGASSATPSSTSTAAAALASTPPSTSSPITPGSASATHTDAAHAADALLFTCLFAVSLHDIESYLLHAAQTNGTDPRTSVQTWHAAPAPTSTPRPPVAVTAALSRDVLSTSLTHSTTVPPAHTRSLSSASTSTTSSASDASDPSTNARVAAPLGSRTPTSTSAPTPSAAAAAAAALDQRKLAARRLARSTYAVAVVVPAECPAVRDFMIRHFTVWESLLDELQALVGAAIRECFSEAVRAASAEQDSVIPALESTRLPAGSSAPSPATSTTTTTPIPMPRNGSNGTSNASSGRASPVPSALARSITVGSLPGTSAATAAAAAAAAAAATAPSSPKPPLRRLFSMGLPMPTGSGPTSSTAPRDSVSRILPGTSPLASSPVGTPSLLRRPPSTVSLASSTASTPASPVLSATPQSPLLGGLYAYVLQDRLLAAAAAVRQLMVAYLATPRIPRPLAPLPQPPVLPAPMLQAVPPTNHRWSTDSATTVPPSPTRSSTSSWFSRRRLSSLTSSVSAASSTVAGSGPGSPTTPTMPRRMSAVLPPAAAAVATNGPPPLPAPCPWVFPSSANLAFVATVVATVMQYAPAWVEAVASDTDSVDALGLPRVVLRPGAKADTRVVVVGAPHETAAWMPLLAVLLDPHAMDPAPAPEPAVTNCAPRRAGNGHPASVPSSAFPPSPAPSPPRPPPMGSVPPRLAPALLVPLPPMDTPTAPAAAATAPVAPTPACTHTPGAATSPFAAHAPCHVPWLTLQAVPSALAPHEWARVRAQVLTSSQDGKNAHVLVVDVKSQTITVLTAVSRSTARAAATRQVRDGHRRVSVALASSFGTTASTGAASTISTTVARATGGVPQTVFAAPLPSMPSPGPAYAALVTAVNAADRAPATATRDVASVVVRARVITAGAPVPPPIVGHAVAVLAVLLLRVPVAEWAGRHARRSSPRLAGYDSEDSDEEEEDDEWEYDPAAGIDEGEESAAAAAGVGEAPQSQIAAAEFYQPPSAKENEVEKEVVKETRRRERPTPVADAALAADLVACDAADVPLLRAVARWLA